MSDEKKFLHDIASPLGAASLMLDSLLEDLEEKKVLQPDDLEALKHVQAAIAKANLLLTTRRDQVKVGTTR
ncbi:MAG: hypothetical protein ABIR96_12265 [Bdellovibrionota bacterium]